MFDVLPLSVLLIVVPLYALYAIGIKVHLVFRPDLWRRYMSTPSATVGGFECWPGCDGQRHLRDVGGGAMMLVSRVAERAWGPDVKIDGVTLAEYRRRARCQSGSASDMEDANFDRGMIGLYLTFIGLAAICVLLLVVQDVFGVAPENTVRLVAFAVVSLVPGIGVAFMILYIIRYLIAHYGGLHLDFQLRTAKRLSTAPRGVLSKICKPTRWDIIPIVATAVAFDALVMAAATAMLDLW